MSTKELGTKLVELVREGKNLEAIDAFYGENVESVEPFEAPDFPRVHKGLEAVKGKATWWVENHEVHDLKATGPFLHGDDRFSVIFELDVTSKPMGQRLNLHEVGVYTVKDGKIVHEEFFYNAPDA